MRVFVCGYPSSLGGADTELWHVLKLWKAHGIDATLIPTAVARRIAHRVARGLGACSSDTGAYCQGRKRLPEEFFPYRPRLHDRFLGVWRRA
jgi:hypothetical protein